MLTLISNLHTHKQIASMGNNQHQIENKILQFYKCQISPDANTNNKYTLNFYNSFPIWMYIANSEAAAEGM